MNLVKILTVLKKQYQSLTIQNVVQKLSWKKIMGKLKLYLIMKIELLISVVKIKSLLLNLILQNQRKRLLVSVILYLEVTRKNLKVKREKLNRENVHQKSVICRRMKFCKRKLKNGIEKVQLEKLNWLPYQQIS